MDFYYERTIWCDCGESFRQTTLTLPLDKLAHQMNWQSKRDFKLEHECMNVELHSSGWRRMKFQHEVRKWYDEQKKRQR